MLPTLTDLRILALEHAMAAKTDMNYFSILNAAGKYFEFLSKDWEKDSNDKGILDNLVAQHSPSDGDVPVPSDNVPF